MLVAYKSALHPTTYSAEQPQMQTLTQLDQTWPAAGLNADAQFIKIRSLCKDAD